MDSCNTPVAGAGSRQCKRNEPFVLPHPILPCSNRRRRSLRIFARALLLQDEELGVDGVAAAAVEPVGEEEGEEDAEEEGQDDGVVGGHVVHFCGVEWDNL